RRIFVNHGQSARLDLKRGLTPFEPEPSDPGDGIAMLPTPPPPDEPEPPSQELPSVADDDLVTVATFRTAPEAELAKTALDAEGIEAFVADAETVTMDWLLGIAVGDVKVQVARSVAAQAREYLEGRRGTHRVEDAADRGQC